MVLKSALAAALCIGLLVLGGPANAAEYRAGEFLGMDLSKAVLSPKRIGPETQFAPVRVKTDDAQTDVDATVWPKLRPCKARRKVQRRAAAGSGACEAGEAAQQSARCTGTRYADPDLALQVRRHLRLAALPAASLGEYQPQGFISKYRRQSGRRHDHAERPRRSRASSWVSSQCCSARPILIEITRS